MKRFAFVFAALALTGAVAFAQDAPAPALKLTGYLGSGLMLYGNNGATSANQNPTLQAMDRNNGGPVDFRLNFNLDTATNGLQFSFWNGSAADFSKTNLQYAFAWASFLDKQITTKVGLQNDNTTGSDNMGYGSNDNNNTSGTNTNTKTGWAAPSGNTPAAVVVATPAAVPGLAIAYYLPLPTTAGLAGDAFGTSRIGAAYTTDMFKVVANYELDGVTSGVQKPAVDFGVKVTAVANLTVRVEGSYVMPTNSAQGTSQFIQDVGYKIALNDTDSVTPYLFVREFLSPNGVTVGSTPAAVAAASNWNGKTANATGSITDLEFMPAVTYKTASVSYNLTAEYATTSGATVNGVTAVYAIEPAVTFTLPAAQSLQIGAAYGTMGGDALDGNFGQNIGGVTSQTNGGNNAAYEVYLDYMYSF